MKTHFYKVQQLDGKLPLPDLLKILEPKSLVDRNRDLNGFENRIEVLNFETHDGADCAMVNFVKLRMDHGPGLGSLTDPTEGFDLAKNQGFAEETSVLFDFTDKHLIIEYNHHGARVTALEEYINRILPDISHKGA